MGVRFRFKNITAPRLVHDRTLPRDCVSCPGLRFWIQGTSISGAISTLGVRRRRDRADVLDTTDCALWSKSPSKSSQRVQSQRVLRRLDPQAMRLAPRFTSGQTSRSSSALPVWMHEAGRVESTQCARRWNGSALCTSRYSSPSPSPVPSQAPGEERGWSWTHPSFQRISLGPFLSDTSESLIKWNAALHLECHMGDELQHEPI